LPLLSANPKTIRKFWQQGKASQRDKLVVDVSYKFPKHDIRKRVQIAYNTDS